MLSHLKRGISQFILALCLILVWIYTLQQPAWALIQDVPWHGIYLDIYIGYFPIYTRDISWYIHGICLDIIHGIYLMQQVGEFTIEYFTVHKKSEGVFKASSVDNIPSLEKYKLRNLKCWDWAFWLADSQWNKYIIYACRTYDVRTINNQSKEGKYSNKKKRH